MSLCSLFSSVLLCGALFGQSASPASSQQKALTPAAHAVTQSPETIAVHTRYQPDRFAARAGTYYRLVWGVSDLSVKSAEGGEVIRFKFHVLDASKAKMLNEKKFEPALIDDQAHVKLVVPLMDKVGKLRQTSPPEAGKTYWMLFSNKGGYVKRGDKVDVVIGKFRADGLVVD
jgi:hypothetical protein